METDFAKGKEKNQSGNVNNEIFKAFGLFLNFHVVEEREVRSRIVILEVCIRVNYFFRVDEFEGLTPNVVKCNILCF